MSDVSRDPTDYLHHFGLQDFRPGQRDVVDAVLAGSDCVCIMPTGGGKSLCYQLPSLMREGVTLVVSPLIALMKDQVDSLMKLGISATFINSTLDMSDQNQRLNELAAGEYDMMYIAPERFRSPRFQEAIAQTSVQLLAIDEAHCISEWGHDFRHDYARIGTFRKQLGDPQTIALTATATDDVRKDVATQLGLREPKVFVSGFARPNLRYVVETHSTFREKLEALRVYLRKTPGSGVIYASTRKGCEEIAESIGQPSQRKVVVYHGGMAMDDRRRVQEAFMSGKADIVVATNAFGMGIDKPDVRFVVHYNIPGTLEAYYQEAGRAGRDGKPSECLLMYSPSDRYIQEFFIDSANPAPETIHAVYEFLRYHEGDPIELTQDELKEEANLSIGTEGVGTCERVLEKCGVLERLEPNRNMAAIRIATDVPTIAELIPRQARNRRKVAKALEQVVGARRHELVYFRPVDVAKSIGMDIAKFTRTLREVTKLDSVDYVPPFRGRAVRMIRRDQEFEQLDIDFAEIEARRKMNFGKLDRVVKFATTSQCRQQQVLTYFGERVSAPCGNCDNCSRFGLTHDSGERNSPALDQAVLKVLSGVARSRGRFGKTVVAQMLSGSRAAKMAKFKLNELSTFGLLSDFKQTDVAKIIDAVASAGMIEVSDADRYRPVVAITSLGSEVMKQKVSVPAVRLPKELDRRFGKRPKAEPATAPALEGSSDAASTASSGEVSPNKTICESDVDTVEPHPKPGNVPDDLGTTLSVAAPGKSVITSDTDGRADAADSNPHIRVDQAHGQVGNSDEGEAGAIVSSESHPAHYWTWRLLTDGYTIAECSAIRRLDRDVLMDHIERSADEGHAIDLKWVFDDLQIAQIQEAMSREGSASIRSLKRGVSKEFSHQELQLFVKCHTRSTSAQG